MTPADPATAMNDPAARATPAADAPAPRRRLRIPRPRPIPRPQIGLAVIALTIGLAAGGAAALFRWLVFGCTWLVTGHTEFGQHGHAASLHVPWLGVAFVLLAPAVGGALYGPLVARFAPEARGHGVPEVMVAVAREGGRIRPPVTVIKALASAICIGFGGSVGREGPIVQIGSAFASTIGQRLRVPPERLRVLVACGAAGGISATFNAPITGVLFGFEIILRAFVPEALVATILSAAAADVVSRAIFGSAPFLTGFPHVLAVPGDLALLLVVVLGLICGLLGLGFQRVLYAFEDRADALWTPRPEWARPVLGGLLLGVVLLALPQLYGVGYPVMNEAVAGHLVVWLVVLLIAGKVLATSLTLAVGGSGGVFAPSLFIGAMAGTAFGEAARGVFGTAAGPTALYAIVGMGAVFGGAAQSPLTAIASVLEMTGEFGVALPVMLGAGVATALTRRLSRASIYTTKLLRRGIDIDRPQTPPRTTGPPRGARSAAVEYPASAAVGGS